ncbi:MAG: 4'-phosphopantetheinyl transferase superfamily protein [Dermatophilaceae bacterium]
MTRATPPGTELWILAEDDVDVVTERLDAHASLSADEIARLGRLVRQGSQRRHIGARLLARWALARHTGTTPAEVEFAHGPFGRPRLAGASPAVDFNLTHTDGLIACAITPYGRIGLDAESYPAREAALTLVPTVLTAREQARLGSMPTHARAGALAEHWVLKEAYTKALGLGLHRRFDSFDIRDDGERLGVHDPHADAQPLPDWQLRLLRCGEGHVMALAAQHDEQAVIARLDIIDAALVLAGHVGATALALPRPQERMSGIAA